MVFLTLGAGFSVSGLALVKSRFKLKAAEFDYEQEEENQSHLAMFKGSMPWLAEPLTDKGELLRSEKDSMRARMELMVLKVRLEYLVLYIHTLTNSLTDCSRLKRISVMSWLNRRIRGIDSAWTAGNAKKAEVGSLVSSRMAIPLKRPV